MPSRWTLRQRVLIPAALLAVAAVGLADGLAAWRLTQALYSEQRAKGTAIAKSLARNAQDLMLKGDASSVQQLVDDYLALDGVNYVYLCDDKDAVVYHTFTPAFPEGLQGLNKPPENSADPVLKRLVVQDRASLDVAMPILAGTLGTAHVGVDLERGRHQIWLMTLGNFGLLAVVLALGLAWLWRQVQHVLAPLDELGRAAEAVEKHGDLTWRAGEIREDETGRLTRAFEAMLRRLAEMPQALAGHSDALAVEVERLRSQHEAQGALMTAQAGALAQAQVTSEEVRQISRQAAEQARGVMEQSTITLAMSDRGSAALARSLESLVAVRERVERLAADVAGLDARARSIEGIIDSVKDLADQSNVLALNAAIEAMRAGEHGQGFGLVAREIRVLADQSVAATQKVKAVLEDLSEGIRKAAQGSRSGALDIQGGLEKVRGSAHDVTEVQASVAGSVERLQSIAEVVRQQDVALEQILLALADQGERMRESEAQQRQTGTAVSVMQGAVRGLKAMVTSFKF